ncbi:thiamine phosphate synthase [Parvibaculum sp.]|jgi:thiamine-phosphate pyrophosphorylase|uniref:thiamine phosphate synthase n=1 Tax=Parvibaculum sp. TaxID=2024848 RepID=UPI000C3680F9|nr:thiamine phosphate synthase [Parvibaculum sp.]MAM94713.1 thiamine phosphate synthase [Parvibaculum sp.]HCX66292.1 thiamine phosphate synthase [Rhodobiaceae bacterium]|tara:strand:+ start:26432 stop:27091 length:660 start_codon:yes stop_codon:yes gene_type:complete
MSDQACRLYLITPPRIEPRAFADTLKAALDAGDVASLQLRLKGENETPPDADAIRKASEILMPLAHSYDVAFLINDRPDLAAELDADGAHIGQTDLAYDETRKLLGPDKIVGVTCHASRHLAMEAGEAGADYVAFGAFYKTDTKSPISMAEPDILTWWSELFELPCVAVGGITVNNAAPLVRAGADFLAVSSGVWSHEAGPATAVRELNRIMVEESKAR